MLPRSHPAGNLPQAASGIESHTVDARGRPFPARWPCQSDIKRHPIRHHHFCQPMSCGRLPAKPDGP